MEISDNYLNPELMYFLNEEDGYVQPKDKPIDIKNKERIVSMDLIKGFSISLIIIAHIATYGLKPEFIGLSAQIYLFLQIFGGNLFIFMTSVGTGYSAFKKKKYFDDKYIRLNIVRKAFYFYLLNVILCIFYRSAALGRLVIDPFTLWSWAIFQAIAMAQIMTYFASKIRKYQRLGIAMLIYYISFPLFEFLNVPMQAAGIDYLNLQYEDFSNPAALIYYIIYSPVDRFPLLPTLAIPFIGSIVGEAVFEISEKNNRVVYMKFTKQMYQNGIALFLVGVIFGFKLHSEPYLGLTDIFLQNYRTADFAWAAIPEFLIQSTTANALTSTGAYLLIFSLVFYLCDVKRKRGRITQFLSFAGMISLSLYMFHPISILFVFGILDIATLFLYSALVIVLLVVGMRIWTNYTFWTMEGLCYIFGKGRHIILRDGTHLHLTWKEAFKFSPKKYLEEKGVKFD